MINQPPYPIYPSLTNNKISLKEIQEENVDEIISITSYNRILAKDKIEAWNMIQQLKQDYQNGKSLHWGIFDQSTDQIIGTCGYYRGFENSRGELGCVLLPKFRRKGYMKQALQLAIDFGYDVLKLNEVFAYTNNDNLDAINLLKSLNFQLTKNINEIEIEMLHKKSDY